MPTTWEVLLDIWPLEDRPERYLNEDFINSLTVETALALMAVWEKQQKKENKGEDTFGKDPRSPRATSTAGRTTAQTCCTPEGGLVY